MLTSTRGLGPSQGNGNGSKVPALTRSLLVESIRQVQHANRGAWNALILEYNGKCPPPSRLP